VEPKKIPRLVSKPSHQSIKGKGKPGNNQSGAGATIEFFAGNRTGAFDPVTPLVDGAHPDSK
jgi:hypothetical protein